MPRFKRRFRVRYTIDGQQDVISYTADVSPGGICVMGTRIPPKGSPIAITIELCEGTGEIRLEGVIAWSKAVPRELQRIQKSSFGVRLVNAPEDWYQQFLAMAA